MIYMCDTCGCKGAETFDAESEDFEYHVYVSDSPTDDIFIVDNARDFGTKEEAIKAAHEFSKDKRGKGKMVYVVAEDREMDIEEVIYTIDEGGDVLNAETFSAESPFKSDAFNEGRSAGITFYTPESTKEDYYANLDTEYMIHYGLSPEDLLNDVENKSPRYLQFIAGFDDGWNYSTLLHEDVIVENKDGDDDMEEIDYEMAGEYFTDYPKGMREHISQTSKEFTLDGLMALGVIASIVGFGFFRNKIMNAEVRLAEESCSGDDDCPEGKVCVDGRCLPICEDDGDCASWQECRDDLHPTEKVCGEQSTDSFQELTTPKPKPQPEVQQDQPKAKESMFNPVSIAIGGGIVAVAVIGMNYLGKKKESE